MREGFFIFRNMNKYLYRGSRKKLTSIKPELVHESDHHKFDGAADKKVVWASADKYSAMIHGAFSSVFPYDINYDRNDNYEYSIIRDSKWREILDLEDKFYLYTLSSKNFVQVKKYTFEYISFKEEKILRIEEMKVKDVFKIPNIYELTLVRI